MKVLLICLVLAQNVNTNSNEQNRAKQQPQSSPVQTALPSSTGVGNSNVRGSGNTTSGGSDKKTGNNSDATGGKTSTDEWAFWVMLATALNAFAAIVLAAISIYQAIQMKRTKEEAAHQVRKMQGQLRVMKQQTALTQKTVMQTARIVKQNERVVKATQGQLTSMQGQEKTMRGQLEEMVRQNERLEESNERERARFEPRLRIDEVRVAGFEIGRSPAFIVSLVNEGATEARNIALYVQAAHGRVRAEWRGEQIVTVPANDRRTYPIRWSPVLSREVIDTYNYEPWLKVFGYFRYKGIEQPFCYHYYPWIGERPAEVPYFVPCDFEVRDDVTLGIHDSSHAHTAENITLTQESKPKPDEGNKNGKDEDEQRNPN